MLQKYHQSVSFTNVCQYMGSDENYSGAKLPKVPTESIVSLALALQSGSPLTSQIDITLHFTSLVIYIPVTYAVF